MPEGWKNRTDSGTRCVLTVLNEKKSSGSSSNFSYWYSAPSVTQRVGGAEQVGARQALVAGLLRERPGDAVLEQEVRDREVPLRVLDAAEDLPAELLVEGRAPDLRLGRARVVEELVEAGHLRGLQGLVGDERALQGLEPGARAASSRTLRLQLRPTLGLNLFFSPEHRRRVDREGRVGREAGDADLLARTRPGLVEEVAARAQRQRSGSWRA